MSDEPGAAHKSYRTYRTYEEIYPRFSECIFSN
jgi:hypothetical protein